MKNIIKKIGVVIIILVTTLCAATADAQEVKGKNPSISVKGIKKLEDVKIDTYYKDQFTKQMFKKDKYSNKKKVC